MTIPKVNYLLKPSREEADCIKNKGLCALKKEYGFLLDTSQHVS